MIVFICLMKECVLFFVQGCGVGCEKVKVPSTHLATRRRQQMSYFVLPMWLHLG